MTDTDVITPDLASVRGYRSHTYPKSSSSVVENVIGLKRPIPVKIRTAAAYRAEDVSVPAWLKPVAERLRDVVRLPAGWDSYGGRPVRRENVEAALHALVAVMTDESPLPWVVPLPSGGVQLEWHNDDGDIEIALDAADSSICIDDDEIPGGIGLWPEALTEIRRRLTP